MTFLGVMYQFASKREETSMSVCMFIEYLSVSALCLQFSICVGIAKPKRICCLNPHSAVLKPW